MASDRSGTGLRASNNQKKGDSSSGAITGLGRSGTIGSGRAETEGVTERYLLLMIGYGVGHFMLLIGRSTTYWETIEMNKRMRWAEFLNPVGGVGRSRFWFGLFVAVVFRMVWPCVATGAGLAPVRLYYQVNQPMSIRIEASDSAALELVVLDRANTETARAKIEGANGEIDLAKVFADIFSIREVRYVQLMEDGEAKGAALVLQPLVTRPTPVLQYSTRGNTKVLQVVSWEEPGADEKVMSGFRVYLEPLVVLHTTEGDIVLIMRPDEAPNTSWNFIDLVENGFFTHIPFHRVVALAGNGEPFVIQAGDPSGTGAGGCAYNIDLEPTKLPHDLGVISMARQGYDVNSASSQFFICLSRAGTQFLDGQYTSFGQTVKGIDVIQAIAATPVDRNDRPTTMRYIETAELIGAAPRVPGTAPEWIKPVEGDAVEASTTKSNENVDR